MRESATNPSLGSSSTVTWKLSIAAVPSDTCADGPKTCANLLPPERSTRTRRVPAYDGRSLALSERGLPATRAPTRLASRKGTMRTVTGCEVMPAVSAWNGPGRAIATFSL